jgi:branched-chain amino acid transport system ATP-binding protein
MNPTEAAEMVMLLRKLREKDLTLIVIEHNMLAMMSLADRIVALNYGKKIAEGTPPQIRNNDAVIDAYLGRIEED